MISQSRCHRRPQAATAAGMSPIGIRMYNMARSVDGWSRWASPVFVFVFVVVVVVVVVFVFVFVKAQSVVRLS